MPQRAVLYLTLINASEYYLGTKSNHGIEIEFVRSRFSYFFFKPKYNLYINT